MAIAFLHVTFLGIALPFVLVVIAGIGTSVSSLKHVMKSTMKKKSSSCKSKFTDPKYKNHDRIAPTISSLLSDAVYY